MKSSKGDENQNLATVPDESPRPAQDGFPELSDEENGVVRIARERGFAKYWPAFPSATTQAQNTFKGALAWLEAAPAPCLSCVEGVAHEHVTGARNAG